MAAQKFDSSQIPPRPDLAFEMQLWERGVQYVAGVDEAGRGALAGPVAAGAVILPADPGLMNHLNGVRDSKQMTPTERELWAEQIKRAAQAYAVGFAGHREIDTLGIVPATRLAVKRALQGLRLPPQHLLVDFLELPEIEVPQTNLVKGDQRSLSIAAASILAKTERDALLRQLDLIYPGYGFAQHKGYGTPAHRLALGRLGPSPIHRLSFAFSLSLAATANMLTGAVSKPPDS
jgi:ribonuclease HII